MFFSKVVAFGDSHVGNFSEVCKTLAFGPETMHRVGKGSIDNHITQFTISGDLDHNFLWIFCFGEIDVRCHIHKQITKYNRSLDSIVQQLIDEYLSKIITYNKNIAVCGVVPASKTENQQDKLIDTINSQYNFIGSDIERNLYAKTLNTYLEYSLNKKNIPYIDMYEKYNIDGFLNSELAADLIHISHKKYINDKVSQLPIINNFM